jgi:poly-gamma-glutamate synthesis protein (capsule biosynthesis protein)
LPTTTGPGATEGPETLTFANGCATGPHITIAAVGDVLFDGGLQQFALSRGNTYGALWRSIEPLLRHADLVYGNLEGPVANRVTFDGKLVADPQRDWRSPVYQAPAAYAGFNYHPQLLADLKKSGFGIVSTANNHALDRGATGVDQTIANLERSGLPFVGTGKHHDTNRDWSTVTNVGGFSLAWVACTYGLNGRPDVWHQVLRCYDEPERVLSEIRRRALDPGIDAVVLVPHWGLELATEIEQQQRDLARRAVDAGALLVIGAHPHTVQPWEKLATPDGREALIIYSNGDFVSDELSKPFRAGLISLIELWKGPQSSKAHIAAAAYAVTRLELAPTPHIVELRSESPVPQLPYGNRVPLTGSLSLPRRCE